MPKDTAGIIAPPPLIFAVPFLAGWALHRWAPGFAFDPPIEIRVLGILTMLLSLVVAGSAFWVMWRHKTAVDPYHPTTALVTSGPFRYTRNPLYIALTLLYTGLSIELGFTGALVLLPVALIVLNLGVVRREERYLERKFGDGYRAYMVRTRRWI